MGRKTMTTLAKVDYLDSVRRYAPRANRLIVQKIIRHLGIALQSRDSSLVACTEKSERIRVREKWLRKKLGLILTDELLDDAIMEVCQDMKTDRFKCRVTFYYLLAAKFGKLGTI
jgi:hypothetical protein